MAKSKNHTNHNQNRKGHRNQNRRPKVPKHPSLSGVDTKFLKNMKYSRKHNLKPTQHIKGFKQNNVKFPTLNHQDMWSTELLAWEEVQRDLHVLLNSTGGGFGGAFPSDNSTDAFTVALAEMYQRACNTNQPTRRLYEFAVSKSYDKLVAMNAAAVPPGILPPHYNAQLHDIKVGGRGPDDAIYNEHPDIRQMIARGTTLISWTGGSDAEELDVLIYANKKFTGGVGDEDETQPENEQVWVSYCMSDPDTADKVVAMEKINGEAAHFSVRYIQNQLFIIAGSKNVHMIIGSNDDVEKYTGDRYRIATEISHTVLKLLSNMEHKNRQILFSLLHYTKSTACCEILLPHNQHVVNLAYLQEPLLKIFAFTPTISEEDEVFSFTALPPHKGLDLAQALDLPCATYQIISTHNVEQFIRESRGMVQSEGHVLYFVKCENGKENTIGMAKTKTEWYIILRALREKAVYCFTTAKKKHGWNLQDRITSTQKRLLELQEWLKFSDESLAQWNILSSDFLTWLNEEVNSGREQGQQLRPQFPIIWERFEQTSSITS